MDYFNKKRWAFWGVALLVIMNVASLATVWFQQHHPPEPFPPPGPPQDRMNAFLRDELELTEAQVEKFTSLQREHFQQAKALHNCQLIIQKSSSRPAG